MLFVSCHSYEFFHFNNLRNQLILVSAVKGCDAGLPGPNHAKKKVLRVAPFTCDSMLRKARGTPYTTMSSG